MHREYISAISSVSTYFLSLKGLRIIQEEEKKDSQPEVEELTGVNWNPLKNMTA